MNKALIVISLLITSRSERSLFVERYASELIYAKEYGITESQLIRAAFLEASSTFTTNLVLALGTPLLAFAVLASIPNAFSTGLLLSMVLAWSFALNLSLILSPNRQFKFSLSRASLGLPILYFGMIFNLWWIESQNFKMWLIQNTLIFGFVFLANAVALTRVGKLTFIRPKLRIVLGTQYLLTLFGALVFEMDFVFKFASVDFPLKAIATVAERFSIALVFLALLVFAVLIRRAGSSKRTGLL
jgi:hypothetical protein